MHSTISPIKSYSNSNLRGNNVVGGVSLYPNMSANVQNKEPTI